jgi:hypothetical protein
MSLITCSICKEPLDLKHSHEVRTGKHVGSVGCRKALRKRISDLEAALWRAGLWASSSLRSVSLIHAAGDTIDRASIRNAILMLVKIEQLAQREGQRHGEPAPNTTDPGTEGENRPDTWTPAQPAAPEGHTGE